MSCTSEQLFTEYFAELEIRGIPSVILHSYGDFPGKVASDVDYTVAEADLPRIRGVLQEVAGRHGWVIAQTLQHQVCAFYSVVIDPMNPAHHLKLDVCSHYVKDGCLLLSDEELLRGRRPLRGFSIPAPSVEFLYVLAKIFGKNKNPGRLLERLVALYAEDPEGAERGFQKLFGNTGRNATEWLKAPLEEWKTLNRIMRSRNRCGPVMKVREALRMIRRVLQPSGLEIFLLGPDGTGKTTLLSNLEVLLEPCFRKQKVLHFRPMLFEKAGRGVVSDPHADPPRSLAASLAKVGYYYLDNLLGYALCILPSVIRSSLVIRDRGFDDMLVDKRYRLKGTDGLVRFLRLLLPRVDMMFILEGSPEIIHERKPELGVAEIDRQQKALRSMGSGMRNCSFVSVDQKPGDVALNVAGNVIRLLAKREAGRRGMTSA
jgi:thymidylate kinase